VVQPHPQKPEVQPIPREQRLNATHPPPQGKKRFNSTSRKQRNSTTPRKQKLISTPRKQRCNPNLQGLKFNTKGSVPPLGVEVHLHPQSAKDQPPTHPPSKGKGRTVIMITLN